jgi:O-antigen/teichoic acid export membrane protein
VDPSLEPEPLAHRPQAQELEQAEVLAEGRGVRVVAGGAWHAAERFVPQFYTLALSVIAARYLGPHDMGRQSYIAFACLAVTALLSTSLWTALVRNVGEAIGRGEAGSVRSLLTWAWRIETVGAAIGAGVLVAAGLGGAEPRNAWFLAGAVAAASILQSVPSAILVGLQRFRQASIVGLTTGIAGVGATAAVLAAGGGITGMFAVEVVIGLVNLAWSGAIARSVLARIAPEPAPSRRLQREVSRFALAYAMGVVLEIIVARRSELFFLDRFSTNQQIAYYSIAFAIAAGAAQIPSGLAYASGPTFANLHGAGAHERITRGFERGRRLLLLFTLPLTALGLALGPAFVRVVYGSEYRATAAPLLILLSTFPMRGTTTLANTVTTAYGRLRLPVTLNWISAALDIGLAAALVPVLDAVGAALASVAAQLVYSVVVMRYVRRLVGAGHLDRRLLRTAVASAVGGAAAWACVEALGDLTGLLVGLAAFAVVFAALARAFRIIPYADADWLADGLATRLGPRAAHICRLCSSRP